MKKIILAVLCLLLAFYVGWPLWSAYKIHSALESNDTPTLESKVDFPSVRASLRPAISAEVGRALDRAAGRGGGLGQILGGAVKQQLGPQVVEAILNGFITPRRVGEIYTRRGDIREIVAERMAKRGKGVAEIPAGEGDRPSAETSPSVETGPTAEPGKDLPLPQPATADGKPREKLSWGNIKRVALTGPLGFEVGIARDKAAVEPDVTAQLGFKDFDWKLVGLVPKPR